MQKVPFGAVEGIGLAEIVDPDVFSICQRTQAEAANQVKAYLSTGFRIAAQDDSLFRDHLTLCDQLLSTAEEELEYNFRMPRSHPSRRWRADAVLVITPTAYHYDILIKDSRSLQTIWRHRIKTTECSFPFYQGIGFSKLRWDRDEIVGLTRNDKEAFRFHTKLDS